MVGLDDAILPAWLRRLHTEWGSTCTLQCVHNRLAAELFWPCRTMSAMSLTRSNIPGCRGKYGLSGNTMQSCLTLTSHHWVTT